MQFKQQPITTTTPSSTECASVTCISEENPYRDCCSLSFSTSVDLLCPPISDTIFDDDCYFMEEFGHSFEMGDCGMPLLTELDIDSLDLPSYYDEMGDCYSDLLM